MNRRGFLAGILAAGVAPAVVGSGILMPVRRIEEVSGLSLLLRAKQAVERELLEASRLANNPPFLIIHPGARDLFRGVTGYRVVELKTLSRSTLTPTNRRRHHAR